MSDLTADGLLRAAIEQMDTLRRRNFEVFAETMFRLIDAVRLLRAEHENYRAASSYHDDYECEVCAFLGGES